MVDFTRLHGVARQEKRHPDSAHRTASSSVNDVQNQCLTLRFRIREQGTVRQTHDERRVTADSVTREEHLLRPDVQNSAV